MQLHYKSLIVAALALITLGLMLLDRTNITPADAPAAETTATQTAPDVTFTTLDGGEISLHSLSGHTVLLHFWASWCVPCREEFSGLMQRMAKDKEDTILLAVSGDENAEDAHRFIAPYKRDYPKLFSSGKVIIANDPHHALISRNHCYLTRSCHAPEDYRPIQPYRPSIAPYSLIK